MLCSVIIFNTDLDSATIELLNSFRMLIFLYNYEGMKMMTRYNHHY